ncbi:MAG TPA: PhoX family phosphatase [Moraxellaceae bacterium]
MDHQAPYDEDAVTNTSDNPHFNDILQVRLSRRQALMGGIKASALFMLGGSALAGCSSDSDDTPASNTPGTSIPAPVLKFTAIAKSLDDIVHVPVGYSAAVLYALGDPIDTATTPWSDAGTETGASYEKRAGDHHDGMAFFGLGSDGKWKADASDRGMLVMNHENITPNFLHANNTTDLASPRLEDPARKEINCHGISVIEIRKNALGKFEIDKTSTRNRRLTPNTPMDLRGAAAGSAWMLSKFSPAGLQTRGTINNCANGYTPWGTYLTCEENWAGYFKRGADTGRSAAEVKLLSRYGVSGSGSNAWSTVTPADPTDTTFAQWDLSLTGAAAADDFRNRANTYGWVVEIDPFDPASTPRKRTALGRMGHEDCAIGKLEAGKPVVFYTGDDSRFEYVYKFVSDALWDPADAGKGMAAGDKYMDAGTLYVAKFNADGSGEWVALKHLSNNLNAANATFPFTSQADVLVATRLAADSVGATKMDRPEWVAVNPRNGEVYLTLTNNTNRGQGANPGVDAANPRNYVDNDGKGQKGNPNGHIIRWREKDDHANATTFQWDIYVFAAEADADATTINLSGLTNDNDMSSPDGLWFDPRGVLWIQTDDGAYTDVTNCMMLAAVPGKVGDGAAATVNGQGTFIGKQPGTDLRRFLVGPKECEITGITMTPDGKAMFVNIQHPGEGGNLAASASHWPYSADATAADASSKRPRSATIVVTRNDGGVIAL